MFVVTTLLLFLMTCPRKEYSFLPVVRGSEGMLHHRLELLCACMCVCACACM